MVREDFSLTNALVGVSTLFCLVFLNSVLSYRFKAVRRAAEGSPVVLVRHGELLHENMDRERVPADEIFSEMHKSDVDDLARVKRAILESDGKLSIVAHEPGEFRRPEERAVLG